MSDGRTRPTSSSAADEAQMAGDAVHLEHLGDQVERLLGGEHPEVLAVVRDAQATWKGLHDRLIAIIAAYIDDAVEEGAELAMLLERVRRRTTVGVASVVTVRPNPERIAALLRSHGAVGDVRSEDNSVVFEHACGSGQQYWRSHPATAKVRDGEVPGVPGGVPRYCARCIDTINALGEGGWRVDPPASVDGRCRWTLTV
ncbi:MAG: hypothetical protein ACO3D9_00520 [Ilumatobacteraceae bacterium]